MTLTPDEYEALVVHLVAAAADLDDDPDLPFPQTQQQFVEALWYDNSDLKAWHATTDEYRDALEDAWARLPSQRVSR